MSLPHIEVPGPIQTNYSREEALAFMQKWLKEKYGDIPKDSYHEKLGFAYDLLTDMFPSTMEEARNRFTK